MNNIENFKNKDIELKIRNQKNSKKTKSLKFNLVIYWLLPDLVL